MSESCAILSLLRIARVPSISVLRCSCAGKKDSARPIIAPGAHRLSTVRVFARWLHALDARAMDAPCPIAHSEFAEPRRYRGIGLAASIPVLSLLPRFRRCDSRFREILTSSHPVFDCSVHAFQIGRDLLTYLIVLVHRMCFEFQIPDRFPVL